MTRALIVSAPRSGSGKTTVTLGLLAALRRRGTAVRAAKAGPDYIDPAFHAAATGAPSPNLDSWAMPPALLDALLAQAARDAEMLVVEGAMGLFDGVAGEAGRSGAAADLAARFGVPVLLVIDVTGQSQSAAAVVAGFAAFDPAVRLAGVILNRVGSERHRGLVADAIARLRVPVLGAIPRDETLALPERHLGLVQASEHGDLAQRLGRLADVVDKHCDLDAICAAAAPLGRKPGHDDSKVIAPPGQRIALAAGRRGDFSILAARRRAAARRLRRVLAAGRLSRAACRRARGRAKIPRRARALRGEPAGAWRVRRLHGAGRIPRGCRGRAPPDDRTARPRHQLRPTPAASRLPGGAPACRQPDRRGRRARARP
jgi:cobyrinic acid a,c-diamide synthase